MKFETSIHILRWLCRIISGILAVLVLMFAVGEGLPDINSIDARTALLFMGFCAMFVGLVMSWFMEKAGGIVILSGFAFFEIINFVSIQSFATNPIFALFPLLGILFIICSHYPKK